MGQLVTQQSTLSSVTMEQLRAQAEQVFRSGIVPSSIKSVEALMVVGMKGMEIGIPMVKALTEIEVIYNKPRPATKLQLELATKRIPGFSYDILENTEATCTVEFRRPGRAPFKFTYTRAEADKAKFSLEQEKKWDEKAKKMVGTGKWNVKDNWEKQPRKMLFYRCCSEALSMFAPDFSSSMDYEIDISDPEAINRQITALNGQERNVTMEPTPVSEFGQVMDDSLAKIIEADFASEITEPDPSKPIKDKLPPINPSSTEKTGVGCAECGVDLTQKVFDFSSEKFGRPLCFDHQQRGGKINA